MAWYMTKDGAYNSEFVELPESHMQKPYPLSIWRIEPGINDGLPFHELLNGIEKDEIEPEAPVIVNGVPITLLQDLLSGEYQPPRLFLCEVDKTPICQLDAYNVQGEFKFNSLSKISFNVDRTYNSFLSGEMLVNPYYDKVEALRLINVEGFGYFEIQGPKLSSDGIKEYKEVEAYSLEYTLSQKYLSNFYINTGEISSVEVTEATDGNIVPVTLYNEQNPKLSLLDLILEKTYGAWSVGYVSPNIQNLNRTFSVDRTSIYDFIMNEICDKFNCFVSFDTINNTINKKFNNNYLNYIYEICYIMRV